MSSKNGWNFRRIARGGHFDLIVIKQLVNARENLINHWLGQTAGERVLLAGMKTPDQISQRVFRIRFDST